MVKDLFRGVQPPVERGPDPESPATDLFAGVQSGEPLTTPAKTEEDVSAIGDFARGVVAAPVSIVRGIGELGALGLDASLDTDTVDDVSGFFDSIEGVVGPKGRAGEATRDVLAFGLGFVPFAGWLGRAGMVAKGARGTGQAASKFMRSAERFGDSAPGRALLGNRSKVLGATALGGGLYEGIISSDGRATLSDMRLSALLTRLFLVWAADLGPWARPR